MTVMKVAVDLWEVGPNGSPLVTVVYALGKGLWDPVLILSASWLMM
jgi:hypothetical protein